MSQPFLQAPSDSAPRCDARSGALHRHGVGILIASGICFAGVLPAESNVSIEMRTKIEVKSSAVRLGDIAAVSSNNPALRRRIAELSLGKAPLPGESICLQRDVLKRWIRSRIGLEEDRIAWTGPQVCSIRMLTQKVTGDRIALCGKQSLQAAFAEYALRTEIYNTRIPQDASVPTGKVELKARPQTGLLKALSAKASANPFCAKRQSVWVDVWVDGRYIRTVPVGFEVSVFAPGYVAIEDIAEGEVIEDSDLDIREVEWSEKDPLPIIQEPTGIVSNGKHPAPARGSSALISQSPVKAGETLSRSQAKVSPLVACGAMATLRSLQNSIQLESRVEVLQDGYLGQTIRVKRSGTSNAISARVIGPGLVEVP